MVKTTIAETLFWVCASRPSSSWRLARVQGQWGCAKSRRVGLSETSWRAQFRGKRATCGAAFTGVNSSSAKTRNPIATNETQKAPATVRNPEDRWLVFAALIRRSLRVTMISQTRHWIQEAAARNPLETPTKSVIVRIAEFTRMNSCYNCKYGNYSSKPARSKADHSSISRCRIFRKKRRSGQEAHRQPFVRF